VHDLLELYLPLQVQGRLTVAQLGQSLDGRIATESGHSHYITGPADIIRLHRLRALVDAVVVGAGTIASDDPRLTVREVEGDNPVRIVLDPHGRLDPNRRVFTDRSARTVHVRRERPGTDREARESDASVLVLPVDAQGLFEPTVVLSALHNLGLKHVLIEGGGVTVSRFLQARAVDRLHVTVAPLIIGSGKPAFTLDPVDTLAGAWRPPCRLFRLGEDVLFDLDLREHK
jgi:diaminohydroxyphosphoribosylaminopyrimidine deaminase/5-amino-6-(5-phosphoribosylamino)uracil reductase